MSSAISVQPMSSLIPPNEGLKPNLTPFFVDGFTNIGPEGFCDCESGSSTDVFPDGTVVIASVMLAFTQMSRFDRTPEDAVYTKGDGNLHVTYTFECAANNDDGFSLLKIDQSYCLGMISAWPNMPSPAPEFAQILNSAANIFASDESEGAAKERTRYVECEAGNAHLVNQVEVVIELGLDVSRSPLNFIRRVIEPGDPAYQAAMFFLPPTFPDGTGLNGKHVPPSRLQAERQETGPYR